jgi:F-type H+-transporting ATPase subunit b
MLFDPFTAVAQLANFLILVWLLRRVLYGPVTRAMDERDARIRRDVEAARRQQEEARVARAALEEQAAAFEAEREARLAEVRAELEEWRRSQMEAARAEMDALRVRWQEALEQEQRAIAAELRRRIGVEVVALAGRVLRDLADTDLAARLTARFLAELRALSADERERLREAAAADGHRVYLRTPPGLGEADLGRLRASVTEALGADLDVVVEPADAATVGVELRAGGLKVAWSLDAYLESLEDRFLATLREA